MFSHYHRISAESLLWMFATFRMDGHYTSGAILEMALLLDDWDDVGMVKELRPLFDNLSIWVFTMRSALGEVYASNVNRILLERAGQYTYQSIDYATSNRLPKELVFYIFQFTNVSAVIEALVEAKSHLIFYRPSELVGCCICGQHSPLHRFFPYWDIREEVFDSVLYRLIPFWSRMEAYQVANSVRRGVPSPFTCLHCMLGMLKRDPSIGADTRDSFSRIICNRYEVFVKCRQNGLCAYPFDDAHDFDYYPDDVYMYCNHCHRTKLGWCLCLSSLLDSGVSDSDISDSE